MKVKVKSLVNGTTVVRDPDLKFNRTWNKKGAVYAIDKDVLEQLMYDPGVEYMFSEGILAIVGEEADQLNVELGLQEEGAPKKIFELTDEKIDEILKMKMADFRKAVKDLSYEQTQELVEYCIAHEITDYDKVMFLKDLTQVNILSAIELNRQDKEEVSAKEE